jgi:hypothetical protein
MSHRDEWLGCLRAAFEGLDRDGDGRLSVAEIMKALSDKLPEEEVGCRGGRRHAWVRACVRAGGRACVRAGGRATGPGEAQQIRRVTPQPVASP